MNGLFIYLVSVTHVEAEGWKILFSTSQRLVPRDTESDFSLGSVFSPPGNRRSAPPPVRSHAPNVRAASLTGLCPHRVLVPPVL